MTANIQTITLDLTNSAYSAAQKVFVVQGDSGTRPVKAVITDNGMVRTDLSHESVCLYIDNNGDRPTYVEGISVVNGVAEFNIPQSAVLNAGTMKAELRFVDEENRVLTSVSFVVEVGASVYDENALLGTDDGDVLIRMVEQAEESAEAAAEMAGKVERLMDSAVLRADIDNCLDSESTNPVENKAVAEECNAIWNELNTAARMQYVENNFVSTLFEQDFEDGQKATARSNIGAVSQAELADGLNEKVDASLVVDNLVSSDNTLLRDNIPNGDAIVNFLGEHGVAASQVQSLSKAKKARARQNIDIDGGKWELLYTIEGDGETKTWEYTQFANGSPLKLTAVSAVVIQDVAEAENSYGFLNAYCDAKSTQFPSAIYNYFTKNSAPTTSGTQRAYGVVEQHKGQYRAYSVGMAKAGNEIMRYTPYMQAKHTTADYPYIDRIKVEKQTGVFSAGNKIEVYGVRCYDGV